MRRLAWCTALALLALIGCGDAGGYDVVVRFAPADLATQTDRIELSLVRDCGEHSLATGGPADGPMQTLVIRRNETSPKLSPVASGSYGLYGRAMASDCAAIAAACQPVQLAENGKGSLVVTLTPVTGGGCGTAMCVDGECVAVDAGPPVDGGAVLPMGDIGRSGTWRLTFQDEFEATTLDDSKWVRCFPWGTTAGCQSTSVPDVWFDPDNITVSGGAAHLRAARGPVTMNGNTYGYTSGMITTASFNGEASYRYVFRYGYIETRARAPRGRGIRANAWMLRPEGVYPPGLTFFSAVGTSSVVQLSFEFSESAGGTDNESATVDAFDWHVYGVEWTSTSIRWFVDGAEARSPFTNASVIPNADLYFIASLHVGDNTSGPPDGTTPFPLEYDLDYVRVWQR